MDVYIFYILVISECFDGLRNGDKYTRNARSVFNIH